jgi:SOS-response transcriptional repressor LexA
MLTPRQKQLYDFLCSEAREGRAPSFRQMADAVGLKTRASAFQLLERIKSRGVLIPVLWNPSLEKMEVGR